MCDPFTFIAAASAGLGALSKIGGGYAQSDLDKFSAQIAGMNAELARGNAQLASAQGALDIGRTAAAVNEAVAGATAHYGAAHLDPTSGSPLLTQLNSVLSGEGDKAIISARTEAAKAGAYAQAASATGQQAMLQVKAGQDIMSGWFGAGTSLLSGLSPLFKGAAWPWQTGATGSSSIMPQFYSETSGTEWG